MLIHLFQGEAFFACASDDGDALKALIPLAFDFPSPAQHWCLFPLHEAKTKGKHFITFFCVPLMFCDVFYHERGLRRGKELFRESTECEADAMFLILPFLNGITFLFRSKLVYRFFIFLSRSTEAEQLGDFSSGFIFNLLWNVRKHLYHFGIFKKHLF